MSADKISKELLHKLILKSFEGRDKAYAPYSKFHVGASLLFADDVIVTGCNVENASYGAGVCAERTAMCKAITEGLNKPLAVVVTSLLPTPSVSPCGICRQFLREFAALDTPIYMVADGYPREESVPSVLDGEGSDGLIKLMTLGELLPMSFGPEHLQYAPADPV